MDRPPRTPSPPPLAQVPPRSNARLRTSPRTKNRTGHSAPENQLLPAYDGSMTGGAYQTFTMDFRNVDRQYEYGSGGSNAADSVPEDLSSWEPTPSPTPFSYEQTIDFGDLMNLEALAQQQQQEMSENYDDFRESVGHGGEDGTSNHFDFGNGSSFIASSPKPATDYELAAAFGMQQAPPTEYETENMSGYYEAQASEQPTRKRQRMDTSLDDEYDAPPPQPPSINPALLHPPYYQTEQNDVPMADGSLEEERGGQDASRTHHIQDQGNAELAHQEVPPPYLDEQRDERTEREFVIDHLLSVLAQTHRQQLEACVTDIPGQPLAENPIVAKLLGTAGRRALQDFSAGQRVALQSYQQRAPQQAPQQGNGEMERKKARPPPSESQPHPQPYSFPSQPMSAGQRASNSKAGRAMQKRAAAAKAEQSASVPEWNEQTSDAWQKVRSDMQPVASSSKTRLPSAVHAIQQTTNAATSYHPASRNLSRQFRSQTDFEFAMQPKDDVPHFRAQTWQPPATNTTRQASSSSTAASAPWSLGTPAATSTPGPSRLAPAAEVCAPRAAEPPSGSKWPMNVDWSKVPRLPPAPMKHNENQELALTQLWNSRLPYLRALGMPPNPYGGYPEIHLRDPEDKLRNVHKDTVAHWREKPNRVILEPFGQDHLSDLQASTTHDSLDKNLKAAMGVQRFGIMPPTRTQNGVQRWEAATAWLSHSWPPLVAMLLIKQRIWIFRDIAFVATADVTTPPKLLFPLVSLTRWDEEHVRDLVMEEFTQGKVYQAIKALVAANQDYAKFENKNEATCRVLDTLEVVVRDVITKTKSTKAAYIYMDPPTKSPKHWVEWRDSLSTYPFSGATVRATVSRRQTRCEMCHGTDHQTDQCLYPHLDGWSVAIEKRTGARGHGGRDEDSGDDAGDRGNAKRKYAQQKPQAARR